MDPNANLTELRALIDRILLDDYHPHEIVRLAELIEALDNWIVGGGYLPTAWEQRRSN